MSEDKVNVAIIGPGNIGTDLIYKIMKRSKYMNLELVISRREESPGLKRAQELGQKTSGKGVEDIRGRNIEIAFDATTAGAHLKAAPILAEEGIVAIDLTPAAIGPYVSPVVNLDEHLDKKNINLITCGGQATIPLIAAISQVVKVKYGEIVATIASKSAGPGTRQSIDEFTQTTTRGIEMVGGAEKGKAIIILNPAEPSIMMRNTIYTIVEGEYREDDIRESINKMVEKIKEYVPGYKVHLGPLFEGNKITTMVEVEGAGDYLPKYAGNLDIETSAAVAIGEKVAKSLLEKRAKA
jgi:acetaldehyde dehydrogenase